MQKSTHTPEYAALRKELRAAREKAELSQRDLADRLAVPHSWVAKIENGERRIDIVEFGWFIVACEGEPCEVYKRLVARMKSTGRAKGDRSK